MNRAHEMNKKRKEKGIKIPKEQLDSNEIHFTSSYTRTTFRIVSMLGSLAIQEHTELLYNNKGAQLAIIY